MPVAISIVVTSIYILDLNYFCFIDKHVSIFLHRFANDVKHLHFIVELLTVLPEEVRYIFYAQAFYEKTRKEGKIKLLGSCTLIFKILSMSSLVDPSEMIFLH